MTNVGRNWACSMLDTAAGLAQIPAAHRMRMLDPRAFDALIAANEALAKTAPRETRPAEAAQ